MIQTNFPPPDFRGCLCNTKAKEIVCVSKQDHGKDGDSLQMNEQSQGTENMNKDQSVPKKKKAEKKKRGGAVAGFFMTLFNVLVFIVILGLAGYLLLTTEKVNSFLSEHGIDLGRLGIKTATEYERPSAGVRDATSSGSVVVTDIPGAETGKSEVSGSGHHDRTTIYCLHSTATDEYLYTADVSEITAFCEAGWEMNGAAWSEPAESSSPVYRLVNPASGEHYYTMDEAMRTQLAQSGWTDEGIAWYSNDEKGIPVYRQFNPYGATGVYHYTSDQNEVSSYLGSGWTDEGIAWYALGDEKEEENIPELTELVLNEEKKVGSSDTNKITVMSEQNTNGAYAYIMVGVDGNSALAENVNAQSLQSFAVDINKYDNYKNVLVEAKLTETVTMVYIFAYDDNNVYSIGSVEASAGAFSPESIDGRGGFTTYKFGNSMVNEVYYFTGRSQNYVIDGTLLADPKPTLGLFNNAAGQVVTGENQYIVMNSEAFIEDVEGTMAITTQLFSAPGGSQSGLVTAGTPVRLTTMQIHTNGSGENVYYFLHSEAASGWVRANDNLLTGMTVAAG